jgi:hypothetical protein
MAGMTRLIRFCFSMTSNFKRLADRRFRRIRIVDSRSSPTYCQVE